MGTAMRFITALGGVVLIAFALGLFGYPIIETLAEPEYADFPGGAAGLVVMLLLMGSVPFGGGVLLIRRAVRGGPRDQTINDDLRGLPESGTPAPPSPVAGVVESAPSIESSMDAAAATDIAAAIEAGGTAMPVAPVPIEASTPVQPLQTTRDTESVPPQRTRRTWLAMLGLAIALGVFLVDAVIVLGAFSDDSLSQGANRVILVLVLLFSAVPLLGGLRLAHVGDPGMGRRFITDLGARVGQLRRPVVLVRTSAGLAFVTAIVSVPAMIIWRDAAPFIGSLALTIFSLIDPLANIRQRSWWVGAFVSAASWFVLFLVTAATTDILSDQPDIVMVFLLPLMAYPAAMALSGLIRFLRWLARP